MNYITRYNMQYVEYLCMCVYSVCYWSWSLTLHCQFCRAWILSNLHAVGARIIKRHLLDYQFAITPFAADLKALGGQDDGAAFVPADATSGVGHGAIEDDATHFKGGFVLQRFYDVDRKL